MRWLQGTFNDPYQGIVPANGILEVMFTCPPNQIWKVTQVTLQMDNAPSGCTAEVRYQNSLHAPAFDASKAAISGDPPMELKGGERGSVRWEGATPGAIGSVLVIYEKGFY